MYQCELERLVGHAAARPQPGTNSAPAASTPAIHGQTRLRPSPLQHRVRPARRSQRAAMLCVHRPSALRSSVRRSPRQRRPVATMRASGTRAHQTARPACSAGFLRVHDLNGPSREQRPNAEARREDAQDAPGGTSPHESDSTLSAETNLKCAAVVPKLERPRRQHVVERWASRRAPAAPEQRLQRQRRGGPVEPSSVRGFDWPPQSARSRPRSAPLSRELGDRPSVRSG